MKITEAEVVARFSRLDAQMLEHWIAVGWLKPPGRRRLFFRRNGHRAHAPAVRPLLRHGAAR